MHDARKNHRSTSEAQIIRYMSSCLPDVDFDVQGQVVISSLAHSLPRLCADQQHSPAVGLSLARAVPARTPRVVSQEAVRCNWPRSIARYVTSNTRSRVAEKHAFVIALRPAQTQPRRPIPQRNPRETELPSLSCWSTLIRLSLCAAVISANAFCETSA